MTKSELKTGMVVTLRNGNKRVVAKDTPFGDGITNITGKNVWKRFDAYTDDLKDVDGQSDYDIMEVANPTSKFKMFNELDSVEVVWTRPDEAPAETAVRRMTMDELRSIFGGDIVIVG